jgi:hypothetical protein
MRFDTELNNIIKEKKQLINDLNIALDDCIQSPISAFYHTCIHTSLLREIADLKALQQKQINIKPVKRVQIVV